jgi:Transmembrane protein 33/Nucleoporin POM33
MILWVVFYFTIPLRLYTNWIVFAALAVGVVKRYGIPKFNKEYLQRIMFDDNLQMLPYLGVVAVGAGANLILYMPLMIHGFLEIAPLFNQLLSSKPNMPIVSSPFIKGYIQKGVQHRSQFVELKADMEVYIGIYLIVVWFIGWSSILTIMMYW